MDIKAVTLAAVLGAAGGIGGSYYLAAGQNNQIQARLHQTPPVVVVDFVRLATSYPDGASQAEVERLMVKTNDAIVRLKKAGYLVLDAGSILGAPDDVYLPAEAIGR